MNSTIGSLVSGKTAGMLASMGILIGTLASTGCGSSKANNATCVTGDLRCACYSNQTCNAGLACVSDVCVDTGIVGSGGNTGQGQSGGANSSGGRADATGGTSEASSGGASPQNTGGASPGSSGGSSTAQIGGTTAIGTGGSPVTTGGSSTGGSSVSQSTGTAPSATGGSPAATGGAPAVTGGAPAATGGAPAATGGAPVSTGGAPPATGGTSSVNNSPVIDAFATCDNQIENNGGRNGKWYSFADADFNATSGFGDPGTKWADHGCAAWQILGCTGTACNYAGVGFQLLQGNPYDCSKYAGVSIALEAGNDIYFDVKTSDGGYFGAWLAATTGNQVRNVNFADLEPMADSPTDLLDTHLITEMQFTIGQSIAVNAGFGMAIHSVSLR